MFFSRKYKLKRVIHFTKLPNTREKSNTEWFLSYVMVNIHMRGPLRNILWCVRLKDVVERTEKRIGKY